MQRLLVTLLTILILPEKKKIKTKKESLFAYIFNTAKLDNKDKNKITTLPKYFTIRKWVIIIKIKIKLR